RRKAKKAPSAAGRRQLTAANSLPASGPPGGLPVQQLSAVSGLVVLDSLDGGQQGKRASPTEGANPDAPATSFDAQPALGRPPSRLPLILAKRFHRQRQPPCIRVRHQPSPDFPRPHRGEANLDNHSGTGVDLVAPRV